MTSKQKLRINIVSESEISVQGHGVHTAYQEMVDALRVRKDIDLITGEFGRLVDCDIVHIHTVGTRTWRKLFQKGPKKVVSAPSSTTRPNVSCVDGSQNTSAA